MSFNNFFFRFSASLITLSLLLTAKAEAYDLRPVNLGLTSFIDGLIPGPGSYLLEYAQFYHTDKFTDSQGNQLGGVDSPDFNTFVLISQYVFVSHKKVLGGNLGWELLLPYVFIHLEPDNALGLTKNGNGFDDLLAGVFLQWNYNTKAGEPIFAQRLNCIWLFPTGKYDKNKSINPGFNFFSFNPYWAATLFITPKWTASWRLHYLWNSKNPKTGIQPGQAYHFNFSTLFAFFNSSCRIGMNGYYLKQFTDTKFKGARVPDSKERVFGIGPGFVWMPRKDFSLIFGYYHESMAQNRTEGSRTLLRFVKKF